MAAVLSSRLVKHYPSPRGGCLPHPSLPHFSLCHSLTPDVRGCSEKLQRDGEKSDLLDSFTCHEQMFEKLSSSQISIFYLCFYKILIYIGVIFIKTYHIVMLLFLSIFFDETEMNKGDQFLKIVLQDEN